MVYGGVPRRARHQRDRRPAEIAPAGGAGAQRPDRRLRRRPGAGRRRSTPPPARPGSTLPVLCRDQHGRQPLRRRAGRAGARPGAPDRATRRICALPGCRPITARRSICAAGTSGSRRSPGAVDKAAADPRPAGAPTASPAPTSPAPAPAPSSSRPASGVYTELQCGSYIFMDADYGRNLDRDGAPTKAFEPSLFVWATVMSRPTDDRAIVDAGLKALAFDSGPPTVWDEPAATYERASDEHGRLGDHRRHQPPQARRQDPARPRPLRPDRQPLRLVCRHPRRPRRALWPITARGAVY